MDNNIGIYKIQNLINQQVYIGQSKNIPKRWQKHKSVAFNDKDSSYDLPLYRAIRKYGLENFSFEIIENCLCEELDEKEKFWIQKYNSFFNGYNMTLGGQATGQKQNKEKIIGIIKDLETTDNTQKEIALKWDISEEMVQGINTGRYWKYDRTYPIRKIKIKKYYCIDCGKEITDYRAVRCKDCSRINSRKVKNRPSREELKQLIRTKTFTKIASDYQVSSNAIKKWCIAENLPSKKTDIKKYTDEEWAKI